MRPVSLLIDPLRRGSRRLSTALAPSVDKGSRARLAALGMLIFVTAFAVRLLHWQDAQVNIDQDSGLMSTLAEPYRQEAKKMIEERRLLYPPGQFDPTDARMIVHPPGYSMLMAAFLARSDDLDSLRLLQVAGDSLASVLVYIIALSLLPLGASVIAGLLAALSPHLAHYSLWLTPESLAVIPVLLAILLIIRAIIRANGRARLLRIAIAGVMIGLSCWLRANGLLLAPFLALACLPLFDRRARGPYAGLLVVTALAVMSPITIRNWIVYGRFIPLSLGSGITLIEGIADYDKENRFGLPATDREAVQKDGEWYGRADYAGNLWTPDGVKRDRDRFARGLSVIRANPGWFMGVALDRAFAMLRYNDSFGHGRNYHIASVATVARDPVFGHRFSDTSRLQQVWVNEPADLIAGGQALSSEAEAFITGFGQAQILAGSDAGFADQFASAPIPLKKSTDYLLEAPVWQRQGVLAAKVTTADKMIAFASRVVRATAEEERKFAQSILPGEPDPSPVAIIQMPFASGEHERALFIISNNGPASARPAVQLGAVRLFELGPTPSQWTRLPRALVRGLQKNIFETTLMLALISSGIALLAFARKLRPLVILLAVPLYYLSLQSLLHTEYRYILVIHYFLFVLAALPVYVAGVASLDLLRRALKRGERRAIKV